MDHTLKAKKKRRFFLFILTTTAALTAFLVIYLFSLINKPIPPPVLTTLSNSTHYTQFICPEGYNYISFEDVQNFKDLICIRDDRLLHFRTQGGGSATCGYGNLKTLSSAPALLNRAICVKTTSSTSNVKLVYGSEHLMCDPGFARATVEESLALISDDCYGFCFNTSFREYDILRIGTQGTLKSYVYSCAINDWDPLEVDSVLCVKRKVLDLRLEEGNEDMCGTGRTPYTVEEVLRDQREENHLCNTIPEGYEGAVRLAGGASMYGRRGNCKILENDHTVRDYALCGVFPRE